MKRPIWFHRDGAAHWVPSSWPGWLILLAFIGGMTAVGLYSFREPLPADAPMRFGVGVVALSALMIAVVLATDDSRRRE